MPCPPLCTDVESIQKSTIRMGTPSDLRPVATVVPVRWTTAIATPHRVVIILVIVNQKVNHIRQQSHTFHQHQTL